MKITENQIRDIVKHIVAEQSKHQKTWVPYGDTYAALPDDEEEHSPKCPCFDEEGAECICDDLRSAADDERAEAYWDRKNNRDDY